MRATFFQMLVLDTNSKPLTTMKRLILLTLPLLMFSCRPWRYDAGPVIQEDRNLPFFNSLSVYGEPDIVFTTDTTYDVRIVAPEKLHDHILTSVSSNRLRIEQTGWNEWRHEDAKIYVAQTLFNDLYFSGSGDVSGAALMMGNGEIKHYGSGDVALSLSASSMLCRMYGSGDLYLTGNVPALDLSSTGSGDVDVHGIPASRVDLVLSGSGDARVSASDTLNISISGSGNVYYWGYPAVLNVNITGSGQLIHMN